MTSRRVRSVAFWLILYAALVIAVLYPWQARSWWDRPFPGFLVYRQQTVGVTMMGWWNGPKAGILAKDRVISVDGRPVTSTDRLYQYVAAKPVGTPVRYGVERAGQSTPLVLTVATQRFSLRDWVAYPVPFWVAAVLHLLVGAVVSLKRPGYSVAQAHWLFCLAMFLNMIGFFSVETTPVLGDAPILASLVLIGVTGINLALRFPRESPLAKSMPKLLLVNAWLGGGCLPLTLLFLSQGNEVTSFPLFYACVGLLAMMTSAVWACFSPSSSTLDRARARIVLWGAFLSFSPIILVVALIPARASLDYPPLQFWAVGAFPLAIAYAILRHQLFEIPYVARRATVYALLCGGLAGLYALIAALGALLFLSSHVSGFIGALGVTAGMRPLYGWLRTRVDRLFLGEQADVLRMVADFRPSKSDGLQAVAAEILAMVKRAFDPTWAELRLDHLPLASRGDSSGREPCLAVSHRLSDGRDVLLALGSKRGEMPYEGDEESSLQMLASHAALALEHAALYEEKVAFSVEAGIARTLAEERRRLLMQILHDLRSDLFNITVAASRLKRQTTSGDALESIRRSLGRIEAFVDEKLEARRDTAEVQSAIKGAGRTMAPKLAAKEQHLHIVQPDAPSHVRLSPVELEQVLINLLDNASKFSPSGTAIGLVASMEDGQLVVRVDDEGAGIPADMLDAIATGERADHRAPGSGLGLQNVRALMDQCGGRLSWCNHERGACVEVRMPVVPSDVSLGGVHEEVEP